MIVAKLPWLAVQQYATVVLYDGPWTVMATLDEHGGIELERNHNGDRCVWRVAPDPMALVTVLISEQADAIRALGEHFDVSIVED